MSKASVVWIAQGLGLDTSGTVPEIEQRIVIANTAADAEILKQTDPDAAYVSMVIATLRHQLAARATFEELGDEDVTKDFFVEEKLEGMRIWLATFNKRAFIYSRNYTLDLRLNAINNLANANLDNFIMSDALCVYDAELYITDPTISRHDKLGSAIAAFTSKCNVKKRATPIVFDVVILEGKRVDNEDYAKRRELAASRVNDRYLNAQLVGDVHQIFDGIVTDQGGEGLVLKQKDCPYLFGERKGWHKLKTGYADGRNEYNAIITGMGDPGKNKNMGLVGSVTISDFDGNPLGEVGNFTDYIRQQLTDEQTGKLKTRLIGKRIEVTAMELTRDKKLRHAAFKRFLD